jgi:hypothetical protein
MPRGRARCVYVTDAGKQFWLWVDRDSLADVNRGWVEMSGDALDPLPRGWLPRRVIGLDTSGLTQRTRVATVSAPLWTGFVRTWQVEASDRTLVTATRIGTQGELAEP